MSPALLLALTVLSAPASAPDVTVVVPDPAAAWKRAERTLRWAALAAPELSPERLRARQVGLLGVDLTSAESLDRLGVKRDRPVTLRLLGEQGVLLIELPLADQRRAQEAVQAAMARRADAQPLAGGTGFVSGPTPSSVFAMHRSSSSLWIAIGEAAQESSDLKPSRTSSRARSTVEWAKDRRLAPLQRSMKRSIARVSRSLTGGRSADATAVVGAAGSLDRLELALFFDDRGFEVRSEARLDLKSEVGLMEAVRTKSSRRLLGSAVQLAPVADVSLALTGTGLRELARVLGLPPAAAGLLGGELHGMLGPRGELVLAAQLSSRADPAAVEALIGQLGERRGRPRARVIEREGRAPILAAWVGNVPPAALEALVEAGDRSEQSALHVVITPKQLLLALRERAAAKDGLGPRPMDLMFATLTLKPLLEATERIRIEASAPTPPKVSAVFRIDHR